MNFNRWIDMQWSLLPSISPTSIVVRLWESLVILVETANYVIIPLACAFDLCIPNFSEISAIILLVDIARLFVTESYEKGLPILDAKKVFVRYLLGQFMFDLITAISLLVHNPIAV